MDYEKFRSDVGSDQARSDKNRSDVTEMLNQAYKDIDENRNTVPRPDLLRYATQAIPSKRFGWLVKTLEEWYSLAETAHDNLPEETADYFKDHIRREYKEYERSIAAMNSITEYDDKTRNKSLIDRLLANRSEHVVTESQTQKNLAASIFGRNRNEE